MLSPDVLLDLVATFASDVLIAYAWTRLLRMRSNLLFWLLMLPFVTLVVSARNEMDADARFFFLIMGYGVIPFVMSVDRPLRKVLVVAFVNVDIIIAELVSICGWYLMTGLDIVDYDVAWSHVGAFTLTHVIHLVVLTLLFVGLHAAFERFDREEGRGTQTFVWFPIVQALMLALALASGVYLRQGSDVLYFGMATLSSVCLLADAALFVSIRRFARKRREDQRAALLQEQLDACLARCDAFVVEVEQTAKMCHDVRNQAHAAMALAERGEFSRAREHISSFGSFYMPKRSKS